MALIEATALTHPLKRCLGDSLTGCKALRGYVESLACSPSKGLRRNMSMEKYGNQDYGEDRLRGNILVLDL